jgi:hypothetical protein
MNRNGWLASALLAMFSLAGIAVLFSQAERRTGPQGGDPSRRWTSLDPGVKDEAFTELVPTALRRGAVIQATDRKGTAQETRATLRLR